MAHEHSREKAPLRLVQDRCTQLKNKMRYILLLPLDSTLRMSVKKTEEDQYSKIGTKSFKWKDSERVDAYYGGNRLVNVQIWYPANF